MNYNLKRYPEYDTDTFQAWNATDEYILDFLNNNSQNAKNILIIEDDFGALSLNLNNYQNIKKIYLVNDSVLSQNGIINNFNLNNQNLEKLVFLSPFDSFPQNIDLVLFKIPKSTTYLKYLCEKINYTLKNQCTIIFSAMVKYLNKNIYEYISKNFASFNSSLAKKKAKIFFAKTISKQNFKDFISKYEFNNLSFVNYPNVFSYDSVDIGSRFFVQTLYSLSGNVEILEDRLKVLDIACGNGILGLSFYNLFLKKISDNEVKLYFSDVSYSSIFSVKKNLQINGLQEKVSVTQCNSATDFKANYFDIVLCNPPFHENQKVSIKPSLEMFKDIYRVLNNNGKLLLVANKHLGYHVLLQKIFANIKILASNNKFIIIKCKK